MAATVAERLWRESAPEAIESDLGSLWLDVGRTGHVARAMMSNLLVVRTSREAGAPETPIDAVAAQHPSRVLVIDHQRAAPDAACTLTAKVGIVTFGPPQARYGVEQIVVRTSCPEASLPSLVRRFTRGNLPISIWWADDFSMLAQMAPLVDMCRQLVYDSRRWRDVRSGVQALAPWLNIDLVDVNWRRLSALRRALAFVAGFCGTIQWDPGAVRVAHAPGEAALAWLLAGWLSARLGWLEAWPTVDEDGQSESILSVTIRCNGEEILAAFSTAHVVVTHGTGAPSIVGVPQEDEADAVAAELHALARDTGLHDTMRALVGFFARS
jgi:glucose-6-phosphate dehydrogenase assembly protein OpcA